MIPVLALLDVRRGATRGAVYLLRIATAPPRSSVHRCGKFVTPHCQLMVFPGRENPESPMAGRPSFPEIAFY